MARQNTFVKVSGDMHENPKFLDWIRDLSRTHFVVICVGGGTQINQAFEKAGLPVTKHGPLGRETRTLEERQLARDILEQNQAELQDELAKRNIQAVVTIPVLVIGDVLCHVNGDVFTQAVYHGFHELYVVTTSDRVKAKTAEFADLEKIKVIGF